MGACLRPVQAASTIRPHHNVPLVLPGRFVRTISMDRWQLEKYKAPAFVGGPYQIWGLTGYILHRLVNDVIRQHLVVM